MLSRTVNLNHHPIGRELDSPQMEVTRVLLLMRLDIAPTAIGELELAWISRYGLLGSLVSSLASNTTW